MIRYTLACDNAHEFEGWFASAADFDRQAEAKLVSCPICTSVVVRKTLMTPAVALAGPKDERQMMVMEKGAGDEIARIREIVTKIRASADDVGERFPEEARKIHYGEADQRGLIGKATPDEARALLEEGIAIAPLPVLPDDLN